MNFLFWSMKRCRLARKDASLCSPDGKPKCDSQWTFSCLLILHIISNTKLPVLEALFSLVFGRRMEIEYECARVRVCVVPRLIPWHRTFSLMFGQHKDPESDDLYVYSAKTPVLLSIFVLGIWASCRLSRVAGPSIGVSSYAVCVHA